MGQLQGRWPDGETSPKSTRAKAFPPSLPPYQYIIRAPAIGQPRIKGTGTAAGEDHDGPRIGLADGGDQFGLALGKIEIGAVVAFLVVIAIQAGDDDGHVGGLGGGDRFLEQRRAALPRPSRPT